MWFERLCLWLSLLERHVLQPALFVGAATHDAPLLVAKFGLWRGALILTVCATKVLVCP